MTCMGWDFPSMKPLVTYALIISYIAAGFVSPPDAKAKEISDGQIIEKTQAVQTCFEKNLLKIKDPKNNHPDQILFNDQANDITVYQQITIFEHIRQNFSVFKSDTDVSSYCEKLLNDYLNVYRDAWNRQQLEKNEFSSKTMDKPLAKPGSQSIESGSWFIDTFHNHWGKHDLGHSDITVVAIMGSLDAASFTKTDELGWVWDRCDCVPDKIAVTLFARAAQAPDLYHWKDFWFHAHSDEAKGKTPSARARASEDGLKHFFETERQLISSFRKAVTEGKYDKAAFILGSACHIVQDLAYHHGISFSEHAGLSYYIFQDPDLLPGSDTLKADLKSPPPVEGASEALKMFNKAVRLTRLLLKTTLHGLSKKDLQKLFGTHANLKLEVDFRELARRSFGVAQEDISTIELMKYLLLAPKHKAEYLQQLVNQDAPWHTETVMNQLVIRLNQE